MYETILCLDVGSGTQDALLWEQGKALENCAKFVLPAPARQVARRIAACTQAGKGVYLHGWNMGGGFWRALKGHIDSGLGVAAHPAAALALGDDMDRVRHMGVIVTDSPPAGYAPVMLCDYAPAFWQGLLEMNGLPLPELVLAAAQDHGFHPCSSNRIGRFTIWRDFLEKWEGRPEALLFQTPPEELTRLQRLQESAGNALVADTGAAAVLGALCDAEVREAQEGQGATVVNLGNSHIIAFLLYKGRIRGVYEHHTGLRDAGELLEDLERFRRGELANQEVLDSRGHGCVSLGAPEGTDGDSFCRQLYAMGPQRSLLEGRGISFPAPGGDMMLMGCFGLLHGLALKQPGFVSPFVPSA